jgi:hypothetical protein
LKRRENSSTRGVSVPTRPAELTVDVIVPKLAGMVRVLSPGFDVTVTRISGWVDQIGVAAAEQVNSMRPEIGDGEGSLAGKRLLDRRCPLFHIRVRTMARQGTRRQSEAGRLSQRRRYRIRIGVLYDTPI